MRTAALASMLAFAMSGSVQAQSDLTACSNLTSESATGANSDCIGRLTVTVQKLLEEIDTLRQATVPSGTVAAFALDTCPPGWTDYVPAKGRMILGAGDHRDQSVSAYTPHGTILSDPTPETGKKPSRGGAETVTLTESQMPAHSHKLLSGDGQQKAFPGPTDTIARTGDKDRGGVSAGAFAYQLRRGAVGTKATAGQSSDAGGGRAHPNMPPYIALYFCEKD